ncbi:AraC family transcriptional regulator [Horticoccus luteus]|uniref:AraC family transcriptional regulator n=1 Tax=Horticoccus luteus TaxID=2862869 RepID=A0A8F9TUP8_9BACT|nr:AraC family transcriptional regulator [Horticoccus luteus]QYM78432.1 AraC family transcriptional regulator [Horticoccus luteus]
MKVYRDPQIISGFLYERPVDELAALTHCGEALCCRGHHRSLHSHEGFEFLYLSRGVATWRAGGEVSTQEMSDLYVAFPGEKHGTGPKPNPENHHLWVGLKLDALGPAARQLATELRARRVRLLTSCPEVEPVLRGLVAQVVAHHPRRLEAVSAYIQLFVTLVSQRLAIGRERPPAATALPYSFPVQRAIAFMEQNLDRRVPLRDLAAMAMARSVPHFCAQFRREVGVSPAAHHLQLRLAAARLTLRQPAAAITETALRHGFSSSQHFSTLFRRSYGLTPRAWRHGSKVAPAP